ncbi:IPT/TIG domain-containing protein [candidate division KSB1 bacterium]|nr:IPT/TIG domain-containing protein [candidate division KSB1 bacterium]
MKQKISMLSLVFIIGGLTALFLGCEADNPASIYKAAETGLPTPVITQILPANNILAGIGEITIVGKNFSTIPAENRVYLGKVQVPVVAATATELKLKSPNLPGDSIAIQVGVQGAYLFSNTLYYQILVTESEIMKFAPDELPYAITCDKDENIYVSLVASGAGKGIKKITPAGQMLDFAPKGGETFWSAIKMGPGGVIYGVRQVRAIFQVTAGVTPASWVSMPKTTAKLVDLDFDSELNIWTVGNNVEIYRVKPDKTIKAFPFTANLRAVRVFQNYLYVAGEKDGKNMVWRFKIVSADELGAEEVYFDFSAAYPGSAIYALTFAGDGDLYLGTDTQDGVVIVHPNMSQEPLYPGLIKPINISFTWGNGNYLYTTRQAGTDITQTIIKVEMLKNGAPYFGR